jgi:GNAT superfamily N-acetyltransferase
MSTSHDEIVRIRDGSEVVVRPVRATDGEALRAFMRSLSDQSRYLRFFSAACDVEASARWAAAADGVRHIGLVAVDPGGQVLAHASCVRLYGPRAEVAVEVDELHRRLGLATVLLRRLAHQAERQGIHRLIAEVLPANHEMLAVFHDEFHASGASKDGEVDLEFPSSSWRLPPDHQPIRR